MTSEPTPFSAHAPEFRERHPVLNAALRGATFFPRGLVRRFSGGHPESDATTALEIAESDFYRTAPEAASAVWLTIGVAWIGFFIPLWDEPLALTGTIWAATGAGAALRWRSARAAWKARASLTGYLPLVWSLEDQIALVRGLMHRETARGTRSAGDSRSTVLLEQALARTLPKAPTSPDAPSSVPSVTPLGSNSDPAPDAEVIARAKDLHAALRAAASGETPRITPSESARIRHVVYGTGFPWTRRHAILLRSLRAADEARWHLPEWSDAWLRNERRRGPEKTASGRVHGVGGGEDRPIVREIGEVPAGTVILGGTQTGKGVVLTNLVSQSIFWGRTTIVVDPKSSPRMWDLVRASAEAVGKDAFRFHPLAADSVAIDVLAGAKRAGEIATRIVDATGMEASDFRSYCLLAVSVVCEAMMVLGEGPTLRSVHYAIFGAGGLESLMTRLADRVVDPWIERYPAARERLEALEPEGIVGRGGKLGAGPAETLRKIAFWEAFLGPGAVKAPLFLVEPQAEELDKTDPDEAVALFGTVTMLWRAMRAERTATLAGERGNPAAARLEAEEKAMSELVSDFRHDVTHREKTISSLRKPLSQLTEGELGRLLSPCVDRIDATVVTLERIVRGRGILYASLDALKDRDLADTVGRLLLAGLVTLAGDLYNTASSGTHADPVELFIDEVSNVANRPLLEIANKGLEAGMHLTIVAQTVNDLGIGMGRREMAEAVLGNLRNVIVCNTEDRTTQEWVCEHVERVRVPVMTAGRSAATTRLGDRSVAESTRIDAEEVPLVKPADLGTLPPQEAFVILSGAVWKVRFPQIRSGVPARLALNAAGEPKPQRRFGERLRYALARLLPRAARVRIENAVAAREAARWTGEARTEAEWLKANG